MPASRERRSNIRRHAILDLHVAAAESDLVESRGFHRRLDVHPKIHNVRDKLRVRLRLIESSHDAKSDSRVALGHECWNNRMQRALMPSEHVRRTRLQVEQRPAVLQ